MLRNIVKKPCPEKVNGSYVYELVKETKSVCVENMKLHIKDENECWPIVSDSEAKLRIRSFFGNDEWQSYLSDCLIGSIIKSLKTDPDLQRRENDFLHPYHIKVINGVWDIIQGRMTDKTSEKKFQRMIQVSVHERGETEESIEFVNFCRRVFNQDYFEVKKQALYEIIGYGISDAMNVKKAIFLIGPSNCGKSVILRFIQRLVGEENVSNVPLSSFSHQFSPVQMYGKAINISGEVPSGTLPGKALDTFKSITGGDRIELESKGNQPFAGTVNTKLLFAGNTLPVFGKTDGTDALLERLHVLIFDKTVEDKERDKNVEDKLWEEREQIVTFALQELKKFYNREMEFITLPDEEHLLQSLSNMVNPITYFIDTCMEYGETEQYAVHISDAYEAYQKLAAAEALPDLKRTEFRKLMMTQPGIRISKTKKRLNKRSPMVCFEGIRLKEPDIRMSDKKQDTEMKYKEGGDGEKR